MTCQGAQTPAQPSVLQMLQAGSSTIRPEEIAVPEAGMAELDHGNGAVSKGYTRTDANNQCAIKKHAGRDGEHRWCLSSSRPSVRSGTPMPPRVLFLRWLLCDDDTAAGPSPGKDAYYGYNQALASACGDSTQGAAGTTFQFMHWEFAERSALATTPLNLSHHACSAVQTGAAPLPSLGLWGDSARHETRSRGDAGCLHNPSTVTPALSAPTLPMQLRCDVHARWIDRSIGAWCRKYSQHREYGSEADVRLCFGSANVNTLSPGEIAATVPYGDQIIS